MVLQFPELTTPTRPARDMAGWFSGLECWGLRVGRTLDGGWYGEKQGWGMEEWMEEGGMENLCSTSRR